MILEGIVTTENADGTVNVAPMGPTVADDYATREDLRHFTLRPFRDSTTYANLKRHGHGVLHVVDDVELLAQAAIGRLDVAHRFMRQPGVEGHILADACRWYAFEARSIDDTSERVTIEAHVTHAARLRDFVGFHRARHAVVEAAILATRVHLLPAEEIDREFARLSTIVNKTGGPAEHRALALLQSYVDEQRQTPHAPAPGRAVRVIAPSRLHFGLLTFGQPEMRQFGGAGAMIDAPGLELLIEPSARFTVSGELAERIERFATRVTSHWQSAEVPRCHLRLTRAPRQHVGLGVGTQLALAVAAGLYSFAGRELPGAVELASMFERGRRSAVGVYGFLEGGFIVEAGKSLGDVLAPLVCRLDLPADWRFVLIVPQGAQGISGDVERRAFDTLRAVPIETTERLCRELMLGMIPAAQSGDIEQFGESLYRYNRASGECFAAAQGGAFAAGETAQLVETIRQLGVRGAGQSSWGPTVFALVPNVDAAQELIEQVRSRRESAGADFILTAPDSSGARVESV